MSEKRKPILKVVILGDSGVGKTSLVHRYAKNIFTQRHKATIGADFLVKDVNVDGKIVKLHFWDTAGQERFNGLGTAYYRGANCCVLVFDVSNPSTFVSIDKWKSDFLKMAAPRDPDKFPFVLLGNKVELNDCKVHPKLVALWCNANHNVPYFDVSAKLNRNIHQAFTTIARLAYDHEDCSNLLEDFVHLDTNLPKIATAETCC
uniref:Ras-related protein Rab-7b n=1 Tax=Lygus hesperus TaxID=30085 RepID=A0A0A9YIR2_LYGHE